MQALASKPVQLSPGNPGLQPRWRHAGGELAGVLLSLPWRSLLPEEASLGWETCLGTALAGCALSACRQGQR